MPSQDSESVSRSKMSMTNEELDELLRASMARMNVASSTMPGLTSFSQTKSTGNTVDLQTDSTLQQSVSASSSKPPSYTSVLNRERFIKGIPSNASGSRSKDFPPLSKPSHASLARSRASMKRQLQQDLNQARAGIQRPDMKHTFKLLCSVDLLFLLDTTNSMEPYLNSVKDQVRSIVAEITKTFFGESEVRIAIVSYKDHNCSPNIQFLDFTSSVEEVHTFLNGLGPGWGMDFPEDVLGGIDKALSASWLQQTRCMIHIGDAPPHGRTLHDFSKRQDNYYALGSEPHGLTYEPLISRLVESKINYAFLRITGYTDRMVLCFSRTYGQGNAVLLPSNKYFLELGSSSSIPMNKLAVEPQFEEFELGTSYSEIARLVLKTVTNSFSRTVGRFTMSRNRGHDISQPGENGVAEPSPGQVANHEIPLEQISPNWDDLGWFDRTIDVTGFCPAGIHNAETLQKMMDSDDNINLNVVELLIHVRSKPFAKGVMRTASCARTDASQSPFVIKSFIKAKRGRAEVAEDMRMQALCKAFALEFNGLLKIEPPLDFVVTSCLQGKRQPESGPSDETLSLEPYIPGTYVKYNNNTSWVNDNKDDEFNQIAQAFSHFTFERSWGHLLVNDLQGVNHLLTDPAIQTKSDNRFTLSDANNGEAGMKLFFISHECNKFCHELGLKSSSDMFLSGEFEFRETWPAMEPTICCSNKFCRSIVRVAQSHESPQYPGHQWCEKCWPQLEGFKIRQVCEESEQHHEFEVSRFFHESQGVPLPHRCPEHRIPDAVESSAAAIGGKMFSKRLSAKPSVASISGKMW